jgi:hypothetical protein
VFRTCIVLAALAACVPARAERAVLECTADAWIAPGETKPHGRETTLEARPKGAVMLAFRTAAVAGWRIEKATLLLHIAAAGRRPAALRIAPLAAAWSEREAVWPAGAPHRGTKRKATPYETDWIAVDLAPADLGAAGIAIVGANARFSARESVGYAPYLLVEGKR